MRDCVEIYQSVSPFCPSVCDHCQVIFVVTGENRRVQSGRDIFFVYIDELEIVLILAEPVAPIDRVGQYIARFRVEIEVLLGVRAPTCKFVEHAELVSAVVAAFRNVRQDLV